MPQETTSCSAGQTAPQKTAEMPVVAAQRATEGVGNGALNTAKIPMVETSSDIDAAPADTNLTANDDGFTSPSPFTSPSTPIPTSTSTSTFIPASTSASISTSTSIPASSYELFAEAHDLGLRSVLGCPYAGMNMLVYKGEVTALRGRNKSGKTSLLLTLAGRMAHNQGTLTILGETMPKYRARVQRRIGLGLFDGVNDLRDNLTVEQVAASELGIFGRSSKREDVEAFLREWGLFDLARMNVGDLPREMLVMLGIALGMAGNPEGLAVDDIEDKLTTRQSTRLMNTLANIAHERNIAVMVACTERSLAAYADRIYELS